MPSRLTPLPGFSLERHFLPLPGFSLERHFRRFGGTIVLRRGCKQWAGPAGVGSHATFSACTLANKHPRLRDE